MSRKHIADDVCPYTCVLQDCTKEDVLYSTKEAWKTHLIEDHRSTKYWVCFPCGGDVQLLTEAAFIAHTKQKHQETILEDQILLLAPISKRSVPADCSGLAHQVEFNASGRERAPAIQQAAEATRTLQRVVGTTAPVKATPTIPQAISDRCKMRDRCPSQTLKAVSHEKLKWIRTSSFGGKELLSLLLLRYFAGQYSLASPTPQ